MNPFTALPPAARRIIYFGYALVGLLVGAIQVGYLAAQAPQPTALTVALAAVVPFLGAGLGITAASNTSTPDAPEMVIAGTSAHRGPEDRVTSSAPPRQLAPHLLTRQRPFEHQGLGGRCVRFRPRARQLTPF